MILPQQTLKRLLVRHKTRIGFEFVAGNFCPPAVLRDGPASTCEAPRCGERWTTHSPSLLSALYISDFFFFFNLQPKCTVHSLLWNTFELRQIQGFTVGKFLFFKIIFISQPEMERDLCQKHCHVLACRCQSKSEFTTCTSWETSMVYGEYIAHKHRPYCM